MSRKNRIPLADRVAKAAEAALAARHFVSAIDVLVGIGWLDPEAVEHWRRGQIDHLERVVRTNLPRISEALKPRRRTGRIGSRRSFPRRSASAWPKKQAVLRNWWSSSH
jgi:hypothetical protein